MVPLEITVEIIPEAVAGMPDGSEERGIGVSIEAPSKQSPSGRAYVAFIVSSLEDIDESYVNTVSFALAKYQIFGDQPSPESVADRGKRQEVTALDAAYHDVVEAALSKAIVDA